MRRAALPLALLLALLATPVAAAGPARTVLADPAFVAGLEEGLVLVYDYRLEAAAARFQRLGATRPAHPVGPLLAAVPLWWELLADPLDTRNDEALHRLIDEALARSDRLIDRDRTDLDGRFMRATALAMRGRLRSLRGSWIAAAWDGKRALDLVRGLAEDDPHNPDLLYGLGLYDYFAAVLPERYPVFRPLGPFFPPGDRERGLARIEAVGREGRFARIEAQWMLLMIRYHFEKDRDATLALVGRLRRDHPENPLFLAYEGRARARWGDCAGASPILHRVLARHQRGEPGYPDGQAEHALFALARCEVDAGRHDRAFAHLDRLERLADARGSDYRSLARVRRGITHDARGDHRAAAASYRAALALPDAGNAHAAAREHLRRADRR